MSESSRHHTMRAYLFAEMTADERTAFEQRIFDDDELFARVCEMEEDLTDELARGQLSSADAARVGSFLKASSQRDRLIFAEALARYRRPRRVPAWQRILPLAACLVLAVGALLLGVRNRSLEQRIGHMPAPAPVAGSVLVAELAPGVLRGSTSGMIIHIPDGAAIAELRLQVRSPGAYPRYRVNVALQSGQPVLALEVAGPLPAELPVAISRGVLTPGEYEITLSGLEPDGVRPIDYYYCVIN